MQLVIEQKKHKPLDALMQEVIFTPLGMTRTDLIYRQDFAADVADRDLTAMPPTLGHALDHLEQDPVLREGLGKTPDGDYLDYFVTTKRAEVRAAHRRPTAPRPAGANASHVACRSRS